VALFRYDGPDFTDREVDIMRLVRPHLIELHLKREQQRSAYPQLTPRQWEIVRLVSRGLGNRQIARHLALSEGTVRKHLENIFERLGATSRSEAVAQVSCWL
jgi:DNA-binding NarL/FixJ family response regulator